MKKIIGILSVLFIISCKNTQTVQETQNEVELLGAGATFPYVLYSKMFYEYNQKTGVKVNYQSIGSGGGIRQLKEKTVDFGATDAFLSDEQLKEFDGEVLHIPICLGAVAITYNLEGNPALNLTPEIIADIYLGKIKKWNDPKIVEVNKEIKLPNSEINVIRRADGSGTTFIFTDYLSKVSEEWKTKVGCGTSVNWPVGMGAKGNEGVTGLVKQIKGSIGYVEVIYAKQNNLPIAKVKNSAGNFVLPDLTAVTAAANIHLPDDTRISITNSQNPVAYPLSSFSWIIVYREQNYNKRSEERAKQLVRLLWWMVNDGQEYHENLLYSKLSNEAKVKAENLIKRITYNGKSVFNSIDEANKK
ncbi:MAG: phosphate ABC transporter substrate-binding protein PstS [Bacteroidales bacterium]|nr:phosphate ABC transporter substrate-binding protein PstS [Bacteroidales bacterium]